MSAIPHNARIKRRDELLANELSENEIVMLDVAGGSYFGLKDVGKAVWDQLSEYTTVDAICSALLERFEVDAETCRLETLALLDQLHSEGLIVVEGEP